MSAPAEIPGWRWSEQAALVGLALAARLVVFRDLAALPFRSAPISDTRAYLDWAHRIAGGDWLGRAEGAFYQAPLYPYFLALVEAAVGAKALVTAALLLQIGIAVAGLLVLSRAVARRFGNAAGRGCMLLGVLYPPALAADAMIQKESLALSLGCLALGGLMDDPSRSSARALFGATWALGALALLRETALLLVAALLLREIVASASRPASVSGEAVRRRWAAVALGLAFSLLPVLVRAVWITGELQLTTSQSGPNFYIGNHSGASGSYEPLLVGRGEPAFERHDADALAERDRGRELSPTEVSSYWWGRGFAFWRDDPGAGLSLLGRKALLLAHRVEIADVEPFEIQTEVSTLLRTLWPIYNFGTLAALAAFGLVLTADRGAVRLLLAWIVLAAVGIVAFYVLGRYRVLLLPPLWVGAALALPIVVSGRLNRRRATIGLVAVLTIGAVAHFPRSWLGLEPRGMAQVNLGVAYATRGDLLAAEKAYRQALVIEPGLFEAELNLGNLLRVTGRFDEAIVHLDRALARSPGDPDVARELEEAARGRDSLRP